MGISAGIQRALRTGIAVLALALVSGAGADRAAAGSYKVLYSFCAHKGCTDGASPAGTLVSDSAGNLFGTTPAGGDNNDGVIFELSPNADKSAYTYSRLHSFCKQTACADGSSPYGTLILDTAGNLYGTTYAGGAANNGGTVFELVRSGGQSVLKTLYKFCPAAGCTDGEQPYYGRLAYQQQSSGTLYNGLSPLYGTTMAGGFGGKGTVFELVLSNGSWVRHTLYHFCDTGDASCPDGETPLSGVVMDQNGVIFGTANKGGVGRGLVFRLQPAKSVYVFCAEDSLCPDGNAPVGQLAVDALGRLVGTTEGGGNSSIDGLVFRVSSHGKYKILHKFCSRTNCTDGQYPLAGVAIDQLGNMFGASQGGSRGGGVLYEIDAAHHFSVLHQFCDGKQCGDGQAPVSAPMIDADGSLFGTLANAGSHGRGSVYEYIP